MKGNWLTNVLLVAVLAVLIGGQLPTSGQSATQPAIAACSTANELRAPEAPLAVSGSISIPAAAFQPQEEGFSFYNFGYIGYLLPFSSHSWGYVAPVYLPQGAIIDQLVCYMTDSYIAENGSCGLGFNLLGINDYHQMAYVNTSGSSGNLVTYEDNIIDFAVVNNDLNAYAMEIVLYYSSLSERIGFDGAKIHYHYNSLYLPSVCR